MSDGPFAIDRCDAYRYRHRISEVLEATDVWAVDHLLDGIYITTDRMLALFEWPLALQSAPPPPDIKDKYLGRALAWDMTHELRIDEEGKRHIYQRYDIQGAKL